MEVRRSAYKHGKSKEDIEHAFRHALRLVESEYHGEERLLVIGPARDGSMLDWLLFPLKTLTESSTPTIYIPSTTTI